jgi:radical SAM superfamily enzyme YgiQ (UPF0313 family)
MKVTLISTSPELSGISSRLSPGGGKLCAPQAARALTELCRNSDYVGLTVFTSDFNLAAQLSQTVRTHTDAGIIWGGVHPTARPVECLEYANLVCVGEGELALKSLMEGKSPHEIPGLWSKSSGQVKQTGPGRMIEDISSLPHQDFSFQDHFRVDPGSGRVDELTSDFYQHPPRKWVAKDPRGNIFVYYRTISSRGCPMACTYCSNVLYHRLYTRHHYRLRSWEDLLDELKRVKAENDFINMISFTEDNFLAREPHEIRRFAEQYRKEIGLPFNAVGHPIHITRERLDPLLEAGLQRLSMGIQSGSAGTLKRYRRPGSPKQVLRAANIIKSYGNRLRPTKYDVISNNPMQPPDEARESVLLLSRLPGKVVDHPLLLLPGTAINDEAYAANLPVDRRLEGYDGYIPRITNYYDLLLRLINLDHFPRWGVRALARPTLYRVGQRWPAWNQAGLKVVEALQKADKFLRKIKKKIKKKIRKRILR